MDGNGELKPKYHITNAPENYLSAPLAFQARAGVNGAIPAVHQGLQAIDLVLIVDVNLEVDDGPVPSVGPQEFSAVGDVDGAP